MPNGSHVHREAARLTDAIEAEMRRMGVWQANEPPPEAMQFEAAFGADRLSFFQWIQFVLVPRVRSIVAEGGEFPPGSQVGAYAVRELDGNHDAADLVSLLCEFDGLFQGGRGHPVELMTTEDEVEAPDVSDAMFAVRGFLIGIQVGNARAAKNHVTRPERDEPAFEPAIGFEIRDFDTSTPVADGDCAVVRTRVSGVAPSGETVTQELPFVVVREDAAWRIHLDRTAGMAATGDAHAGAAVALEGAMRTAMETMGGALDAALEGVGAAIAGSFDDERESEFKAAIASFEGITRRQLGEDLSPRFGVPVTLEVDWSACEHSDSRVHELSSWLGNEFLSAVSSAREPGKDFLVAGLARVVASFAPLCAEQGYRRDGDALRVVIDPKFGPGLQWPTAARVLELTADPALRDQFAAAWEGAGLLRDRLRDVHGIDVIVEPNWQTFTRDFDSSVNAWSLYRLAENGLTPFAAALDGLFADDAAARDAARASLREVRIETAEDPASRALTFEDGTLTYALFVSETHTDTWTADELRERLAALFGGGGAKPAPTAKKRKKKGRS